MRMVVPHEHWRRFGSGKYFPPDLRGPEDWAFGDCVRRPSSSSARVRNFLAAARILSLISSSTNAFKSTTCPP